MDTGLRVHRNPLSEELMLPGNHRLTDSETHPDDGESRKGWRHIAPRGVRRQSEIDHVTREREERQDADAEDHLEAHDGQELTASGSRNQPDRTGKVLGYLEARGAGR